MLAKRSHESLWAFTTKSFLGVSYLTNAIVEAWVAAAGILGKKIMRFIKLLNTAASLHDFLLSSEVTRRKSNLCFLEERKRAMRSNIKKF